MLSGECNTPFCNGTKTVLTHTVIGLDHLALFISFGEAAVADFLIIGTLLFAPEAIPVALKGDYLITSAAGSVENTIGYGSLALTSVNDILSGYSYVAHNGDIYVGNDTATAFKYAALGTIPEANVDLYISKQQLEYDFGRLSGDIQPNSINITAWVQQQLRKVFGFFNP